MRRREFTIASLSLLSQGFDAAAQAKRSIIGYLHVGELAQYREMIEVFIQALNVAGFVEGRNISIIYKWAENDLDRLPRMAEELAALGVDVIVTGGGAPAAIAARNATSRIPIVFSMGEDPVALGLVSSLNRPGKIITGSTFLGLALWSKRMELVRDLFPNATKVALLVDFSSSTVQTEITESLHAARTIGLSPEHFGISSAGELDQALLNLVASRPDVIVAGSSVRLTRLRAKIIASAQSALVPLIGTTSGWVRSGAIASIGGRLVDGYQHSGEYVAKILTGALPSDLPVLLPSRFETSLNVGVANNLGFHFSQATLARADEVIE